MLFKEIVSLKRSLLNRLNIKCTNEKFTRAFCLTVGLSPLFASPVVMAMPASVLEPLVQLTPAPNLSTAYDVNANLAPKTSSGHIAPPKTGAESWLEKSQEAVFIQSIEQPNIPTVAWIPSKTVDDVREVGFYEGLDQHPQFMMTHVGTVIVDDKLRYAVNFDGGELVYFDFSLLNNLPSNEQADIQRQLKNKGPLFLNEGHVMLSTNVKDSLIENTIVNYVGMVEANHISIKNDHIVLERKEPAVKLTKLDVE